MKRLLISVSMVVGAMLAATSVGMAGPQYIRQNREISLSIPDSGGVPQTRRAVTGGTETFDQQLQREHRKGEPPSNDDGAFGFVSQLSTMGESTIDFAGRIEADTLYSTDGTASGVAADIASLISVRFLINEPTNFLLASFVTRFDDPEPDPIQLTASLRDEQGTALLEHLNRGFGEQSRSATLGPGVYTLAARVAPEGYSGQGQWSVGDYALSVAFSPIPGGTNSGGAISAPSIGGAGGTEVIPLPGQTWVTLGVFSAAVSLVLRQR